MEIEVKLIESTCGMSEKHRITKPLHPGEVIIHGMINWIPWKSTTSILQILKFLDIAKCLSRLIFQRKLIFT